MSRPRSGPAPSPAQALLTLRIIGGSLAAGVTTFAVVAWIARPEAPPSGLPADPTLVLALVLAVALGAAIAALALWRARVAPHFEAPGVGDDAAARLARIQPTLILVWALVEGASLFAVAVYFLFGLALAGAIGVVLIWSALAATWPKREWIEPAG